MQAARASGPRCDLGNADHISARNIAQARQGLADASGPAHHLLAAHRPTFKISWIQSPYGISTSHVSGLKA